MRFSNGSVVRAKRERERRRRTVFRKAKERDDVAFFTSRYTGGYLAYRTREKARSTRESAINAARLMEMSGIIRSLCGSFARTYDVSSFVDRFANIRRFCVSSRARFKNSVLRINIRARVSIKKLYRYRQMRLV